MKEMYIVNSSCFNGHETIVCWPKYQEMLQEDYQQETEVTQSVLLLNKSPARSHTITKL